MKAVTWRGVNEIGVEDVPEPTILNHHDKPVDMAVTIEVGNDFADLFEVKDALGK